MPTTEEQHVSTQDTAESQDAGKLRDLAKTACMPDLYQELRNLHDQAQKALASDLNEEESQAALDKIYEASDALQITVADAAVALDELQDLLTAAEEKLVKTVNGEEMG